MIRPLKKLLDLGEKQFTGSGKFNRLKPLFDATKTFFFFPSPKTRNTPFVRDSLDLKRFMSFVLIALTPALIFGIYNTGFQALSETIKSAKAFL